MTILLVTGTSTGVGKTVATAALAAAAVRQGIDVTVCKPVQTGDDHDAGEVARLSGVTRVQTLVRYPEPLAPVASASRAGLELLDHTQMATAIVTLDRPGALTLVEGAGGLLVELAADGKTLRDLAMVLDAPVLVVTTADLGTLNHTALTLEALAIQSVPCAGLVVGSFPAEPDLAQRLNRENLANQFGTPVRAVIPEGAARLMPPVFAELSIELFEPQWVAGLVA
ncbi:dethiobiotin synthase [Mycobacteroides abscessus]|uniref:dethiobiotin synthase n=1 Tax=Mycobacteroides abscessus TaxID=36809 RepID=UPI000241D49B|nr:dethiobiotin synthase [Mycobacteroides abscessus]AMU21533.1 dethiobiotin synthase [Mycobacteroides abscessus]EHM19438.1 dithiobiotin synthetase [Mycobacteroides abscessus subsp. bolletii BD]ORA26787.1 ATP-dependent dethiobiotin synthetase BioD [Mycobacteroides abscessus subsp. bolletii]TPF69528.1 dethiobiotin synthetase [Mycobacteroides abscessus subsp. bolletii]SHZ08087.1 Dethiobiotin synthetase (BioD) [Mycobacteroides abscessus subsp. bolletii]